MLTQTVIKSQSECEVLPKNRLQSVTSVITHTAQYRVQHAHQYANAPPAILSKVLTVIHSKLCTCVTPTLTSRGAMLLSSSPPLPFKNPIPPRRNPPDM